MTQHETHNVDQQGQHSANLVDTSNNPEFVAYYEEQSRQADVIQRIKRLKTVLLRFYREKTGIGESDKLNVIDIGCGAGTQAIIWAEDGHQVTGLDVSEELVALGRERMAKAGVMVDFKVGTSSQLPLPSAQMDICLLPELLEHVPLWRETLSECCRVLKPGGMLYISTSNLLCPVQDEFNLPLYSWYPAFLKRICEKKAVTSHRHWVNYATYPAVHWFTNPGLEKLISGMGFHCYDRFDIMDLSDKPLWKVVLVKHLILRIRPLRWLTYFLAVSTVVVAIKK